MITYEGLHLHALTRTVFVPSSEKFAVVINPKSACSTLKRSIWQREYEIGATLHVPPGGRGGIHRPNSTALTKAKTEDLERSIFGKPVFSLVRNPYTRLLSAFLDKIERDKKEKRHLLLGMGEATNRKVEFSEFVSFLCQQNSREMDAHYSPQAFLMQIEYVPYTKIGSVEDIDLSIEEVLGLAYNDVHSKGVEFRHHRTDASSVLQQYYTEELASKVLDRYQIDFDTFGYRRALNESNMPPCRLVETCSNSGTKADAILRPAIQAATTEKFGDEQQAFDILSTIPSEEPELEAMRGRVLLKLSRPAEALAHLRRAVNKGGPVGQYLILLSECLAANKRYSEAAEVADLVAAVAPYSGLLRRALPIWKAANQLSKRDHFKRMILQIETFSMQRAKSS